MAYWLALPNLIKIHSTLTLLKPYHDDPDPTRKQIERAPSLMQKELEREVERIKSQELWRESKEQACYSPSQMEGFAESEAT